MTESFDPRLTPWRADLAAAHLEGRIAAAAYAEGALRRVIAPSAPVHAAPAASAMLATEALFGETVAVYEERAGWAWGQLTADGYVGYLPAGLIGPEGGAATHRVGALRTYLFAEADLKSPATGPVSLNAPVRVVGESGAYAALEHGGFVPRRHLAALETREPDFVAVAERFVGTPYLWGGRTSLGLDCSALVQLSLAAAGIAAPRDSDMQERALGRALTQDEAAEPLRRGDLLFWKGHVAIALGAEQIVHANASHMETVIEPLAEAVRRIAGIAGPVASVRRFASDDVE